MKDGSVPSFQRVLCVVVCLMLISGRYRTLRARKATRRYRRPISNRWSRRSRSIPTNS